MCGVCGGGGIQFVSSVMTPINYGSDPQREVRNQLLQLTFTDGLLSSLRLLSGYTF